LRVQPSRCAVVGDTGADVGAALAAGAVPILVPNHRTLRSEIATAPTVSKDVYSAVELILGAQ
jgi:beta-phosphoglucomutase-like phosphatase (HAD superfamily)